MSLQIWNNIIGTCVRLKFENVNYSSEINNADAQTSNTSTRLWFYWIITKIHPHFKILDPRLGLKEESRCNILDTSSIFAGNRVAMNHLYVKLETTWEPFVVLSLVSIWSSGSSQSLQSFQNISTTGGIGSFIISIASKARDAGSSAMSLGQTIEFLRVFCKQAT